MARTNGFTAQQFIDAIPGTGGIVATIAKRVGCVWRTAKKYIDTYPTVAQAYDDESESVLDLAESKLLQAIKDGDGRMIRYMLSTKGKQRGYVEKQEVEHSGNREVTVRVVYDKPINGSGSPGSPTDATPEAG